MQDAYAYLDFVEPQLKAFARSMTRNKILLKLLENNMTYDTLSEILGVSDSAVAHAAKDLEKEDLLCRIERGLYSLTNLGRTEALLLATEVKTLAMLYKEKDFWQKHDMSSVPKDLQIKLGMLTKSTMTKSDVTSPLKGHENFLDIIRKSNAIYGCSSVIAPGYADAVNEDIERGVPVEIILTGDVWQLLEKKYPDYVKYLSYENFKAYSLPNGHRIAFMVTDSFLSLGLFNFDGEYALTEDLICEGESSVQWGIELFDYYRKKATPLRF